MPVETAQIGFIVWIKFLNLFFMLTVAVGPESSTTGKALTHFPAVCSHLLKGLIMSEAIELFCSLFQSTKKPDRRSRKQQLTR